VLLKVESLVSSAFGIKPDGIEIRALKDFVDQVLKPDHGVRAVSVLHGGQIELYFL
jgi:hypothetical protein